MITFISIAILFLLILLADFISYKRDKELEKRISDLENKIIVLEAINSELRQLMSNFLQK
jgi:hypothetical protein